MDVAICRGKSCRRRAESDVLCDRLTPHDTVVEVTCLGVCKGPVVVVDPGGATPLVLSRVRSPKAIRDVGRITRDGRSPSRRLRDRAVTGAARVKALRRLERALRR